MGSSPSIARISIPTSVRLPIGTGLTAYQPCMSTTQGFFFPFNNYLNEIPSV